MASNSICGAGAHRGLTPPLLTSHVAAFTRATVCFIASQLGFKLVWGTRFASVTQHLLALRGLKLCLLCRGWKRANVSTNTQDRCQRSRLIIDNRRLFLLNSRRIIFSCKCPCWLAMLAMPTLSCAAPVVSVWRTNTLSYLKLTASRRANRESYRPWCYCLALLACSS